MYYSRYGTVFAHFMTAVDERIIVSCKMFAVQDGDNCKILSRVAVLRVIWSLGNAHGCAPSRMRWTHICSAVASVFS